MCLNASNGINFPILRMLFCLKCALSFFGFLYFSYCKRNFRLVQIFICSYKIAITQGESPVKNFCGNLYKSVIYKLIMCKRFVVLSRSTADRRLFIFWPIGLDWDPSSTTQSIPTVVLFMGYEL